MLNGGLLKVTGRGANVNFTIDDRAPFEAVIAGVEECLVNNRHLFSKGNITVNVGRRILAPEELTQIKRILEAESGLTVSQFWCSPEVLEETLSDIGSAQPPEALGEVLEKDPPMLVQDLTDYQAASQTLADLQTLLPRLDPAQPDRAGIEEPDQAGDSAGQTLDWPSPNFSSVPLSAEKEAPVETEKEPLPPEESQDLESSSSPEAEARHDSQALAEPAAQISPQGVGEPVPEHGGPQAVEEATRKPSKEASEEPILEPAIEPIIEPSLLELALIGLEESIAAGRAIEGGLESDQEGSRASLELGLESIQPEMESPALELREFVSPELVSEKTGPEADAPAVTGVETSISPHPVIREIRGLDRQNEALLIKTTCRSGEVIRYPGDVVILADVNPGAEIIADGDILVFGSLRGLAHAGAGGNIQATIIALKMESPRIQIGPYTGMAPKAKKRGKSNRPGPTLAFVRRQQILVAPFKGRFAGYSGGTTYDG